MVENLSKEMILELKEVGANEDNERKFFGFIKLGGEIVGNFSGFADEDDYCSHQSVSEVYYNIGKLELAEDNSPEIIEVLDKLLYQIIDGKKLRDFYLNN